MKPRTVPTLALALGLLAAPLASEAQQTTKVARIGYLASNLTSNPDLHEAFRHQVIE